MSIDEIRELKHAKPFRPFEIVTKNGRKVQIEQLMRIALSPTGDSVAGFGRNGSFYLSLSEIATVRTKRKCKKRATMTVEQIVRRQNAAPFLPHRLFLANGCERLIQHPDFLKELVTVFDLSGAAEIVDLTRVVLLRYERSPTRQHELL